MKKGDLVRAKGSLNPRTRYSAYVIKKARKKTECVVRVKKESKASDGPLGVNDLDIEMVETAEEASYEEIEIEPGQVFLVERARAMPPEMRGAFKRSPRLAELVDMMSGRILYAPKEHLEGAG